MSSDTLVEEVPVALVFNGISHAVLMAVSSDLEDLAAGFSLTEGIIDQYENIRGIELHRGCSGIELQLDISSRCFQRLKLKRRNMTGTTGCGICGAEQLAHVNRELLPLDHTLNIGSRQIEQAFASLKQQQKLNHLTGASHAAAYVLPDGEVVAVREDVGRHIALDKLIGHIARHHLRGGAILVTSRASFEMVQKTVAAGVEMLCAISAVTKMAVDLAEKSNLTLAGFCRPGKVSIYSHPDRVIVPGVNADILTSNTLHTPVSAGYQL